MSKDKEETILRLFLKDGKAYIELPNKMRMLLVHEEFHTAIIDYLKQVSEEFLLMFAEDVDFLEEISLLKDAWKLMEEELREQESRRR